MGQFGFIKGRSTQSELLAHYNETYEAISEGKRTATVFLDLTIPFNKVNHEILLQKVKKQGIGGKIGTWFEEFLKDRKFRGVVNGCMTEEEDIISGVLQGMVLVAVLLQTKR